MTDKEFQELQDKLKEESKKRQEKIRQQRRLKRVSISQFDILRLFTIPPVEMGNDCVMFYNSNRLDLPVEYEVKSVCYDYAEQCFHIIVYSPQWPIIEEGQTIPKLEFTDKVVEVRGRYIKQEERKFYL